MKQLTALTKIGDKHLATGRWVLYQHKARMLSEIEKVGDWEADDTALASRAYSARAGRVHRGGLWLVAPDGKVTACIWVLARRYA